jgi:signal transduction histidine kinase
LDAWDSIDGAPAMPKKRSTPILAAFLLSLLTAIALLVVWVVYALSARARVHELGERVGVAAGGLHWVVLTIGCALLALLIVGVSYQLAQALAARRYSAQHEEFVSNISHEMRSPLAAIKLHAQTLQQPGLSAAERASSARFILEQAERMGTLVDNVLESSRLVARKVRLELEPVALAPFFARYLGAARERIERRGVHLAARVDSEARVLATDDALRRVLDNLLDNAERFSERGGEVRCRVSDRAGTVVIEVEDDGVGVPNKELKKIFDRFYQARGDGRRRGGTGLGLSIVSGLVREMGGGVRAHSQEGRPGARFVVELPAAEAAS